MEKNTNVRLFKTEEMDLLSKDFRLTIHPSPDRRFSIPALDLLNKERCLAYLDRVTSLFQSSSKAAILSQFSKRYAYLTMASGLYAMTMFDKGLDYSIENGHIESRYQDKNWLPELRLTDWQGSWPADGERDAWRERVIKSIFAENIAKVWRSISESASFPIAVLWENTAISVYWMYEKRMVEGASNKQKTRIHEDFQYLLQEASAFLFGETENPLARFYSPKCTTAASDQPIRVRKTCCYYYMVSPDRNYCITCPIAKH